MYARYVEDHLFDLHARLKSGDWEHGGYQTFTVCDPKPRLIHKASVEDRVVHHALVRMIEPMFDRSFIFDSWSCRRGKGTHRAVARLCSQLRRVAQETRKPVWVLKVDVKKYFASVDQDILLGLVKKNMYDSALLSMVEQMIWSYPTGLPLGNLTSQLFANVYLNSFDHFVKEHLRPLGYLRYCDDMVFVHSDKDWLYRCLHGVERYLASALHLRLHPQKIFLRPWHHGIDWLGMMVYPDRVMMRATTKRRMKNRLNTMVENYLDRVVDDDVVRSSIASYDGLLQGTDEGYQRGFYRALYQCL